MGFTNVKPICVSLVLNRFWQTCGTECRLLAADSARAFKQRKCWATHQDILFCGAIEGQPRAKLLPHKPNQVETTSCDAPEIRRRAIRCRDQANSGRAAKEQPS